MNNAVELKFKKTLVALAGNPFGEKTFKEQVKKNVDTNEQITLIFPSNIESVAPSFVQGFFSEWQRTWGVGRIKKMVTIQSEQEGFAEKFMSNLT